MTAISGSQRPVADELSTRFRPGSRRVALTGVQAVARLLAEQHARDARAGRSTASLVAGYPGSPLAGLDKTLATVPELSQQSDMRLIPGINEELAATAVWGSQLPLPKGTPTHDGVVGVWYGKGPGADRSSDVLRHGNLYGANPTGGVLVLVGDDPDAKSSTVPCATERSLASLGMPVMFPRNSEELITFGLRGIELSRASGCWVGMKIVADVADGFWTVDKDFSSLATAIPQVSWKGAPWTYQQCMPLGPSQGLVAETDLVGPRWAALEAFAAANPFDHIEVDPTDAWCGLACVGTNYDHVRQALRELGLDEEALRRAGIRLMRIGMPYPLSSTTMRGFARGLRELVIVEEKSAFVETQARDVLYDVVDAPRVLGKRDREGQTLIPANGALNADRLIGPLRRLFNARVQLSAPKTARRTLPLTAVSRIPYFCSGCPHNGSTVLPEGSIGGGGIGCHTMVTVAPRQSAQVTSITQMGGEGAQWIGQAPFTDLEHIFQNVGDGTFFHSGQLAVQACVAADVNITYKILYNSAIAMTGGQQAPGLLDVPALTHKLHSEGVKQIVICTDKPLKYGRRPTSKAGLAPGVLVWHRDRIDEAQRMLREIRGVTVVIYDQECAAEARRLRKRGKRKPVTTRVVINEAVCEGCGDCGVKSNCLSVQPVETEFGRKTRIDQSSCNIDFSCLKGDCPSFVTVEVEPAPQAAAPRPAPPQVTDPVLPRVRSSYDIYLAGIGGTGVVTVNQVLATAALRHGLQPSGLDQTGLSQKAGPVTSHLRLSNSEIENSNRISQNSADCYLAFDLMVATEPANLDRCDATVTVAVASTSRTPTGPMVYDASINYPEEAQLLTQLSTAANRVVSLDAISTSRTLVGTADVANFMIVGAAYQAGLLPMPASAIEAALDINGVAVKANISAFRWGRVAIAEPSAFAAAAADPSMVAPATTDPDPDRWVSDTDLVGEIRRLVGVRASDLRKHSGASAARRYVDAVQVAARAERRVGDGTEFSAAIARGLHRFLAYKDEYEVARLLTDPSAQQAVVGQVAGAKRVAFNLHPPLLRAAGMHKKISLGSSWQPLLRTLARGRVLRGRWLDPFGHTLIRRVERALIDDYVTLAERLEIDLTTIGSERATIVADTADLVRGFEEIKMRNVVAYRDRRAELGYPVGAVLIRLLSGFATDPGADGE